jgi:hypothetical protein
VSSGNCDSLIDLVDPNDNMAYEMHQYLDSDGSGTSETCVSSTIGKERLEAATSWLQANGKKGFLGEIGAGSNDDCITAVQGALCSMQQADGVWIGALWWAAGPWCKSPLPSSGMHFIDVNTAQGVLTTSRSSHLVVRPLKESCRRRSFHLLSSHDTEGDGGNWGCKFLCDGCSNYIINIFQRPVAVCIICLIMIQVFVLSLENSLQHYEKGKKSLGRDSRAGCVEIRGKNEYRRKGRTTNELADFFCKMLVPIS